MKLTVFFSTALILQALAETHAQSITLNAHNATLQEVMNEVQQQQGYSFFFLGSQIATMRISVNVKQVDIAEAMDAILTKKGLDWYIEEKTIVIKRSSKQQAHLQVLAPSQASQQFTITGRVKDPDGNPLEGVTGSASRKPARQPQRMWTVAMPLILRNGTICFHFRLWVLKPPNCRLPVDPLLMSPWRRLSAIWMKWS